MASILFVMLISQLNSWALAEHTSGLARCMFAWTVLGNPNGEGPGLELDH